MSDVRRYLASIGRKGGMKSRRTLDAETARAMVRAREARRVVRQDAARRRSGDDRAPHGVMPSVLDRQLKQYREMSPSQKLVVADGLWDVALEATKAGIRLRNPTFDDAAVETAALRLLRHASE